MKAELKQFWSNDTNDWDDWQPADPTNEMHWFSVDVRANGEEGTEHFQVAIATRRAVAE